MPNGGLRMSLKIKHVDYKRGTALVQGRNKTFPVTVAPEIKFDICVGDLAKVVKSVVTGEWIMTDFTRMWGDVE